jgi:hypothetical protein
MRDGADRCRINIQAALALAVTMPVPPKLAHNSLSTYINIR